ncbi:MAG: DNA repair helicase XPB [Myxococcota bacterium]
MIYRPDNPLIVQSDHTILLETQGARFEEGRDALLGFAELVKSPEYVHTWRITPLSLWNAAAAGHTADELAETLNALAKYPVPESVIDTVHRQFARYGKLRLVRDGEYLRLESDDPLDLDEVSRLSPVQGLLSEHITPTSVRVAARSRGELKQVLTSLGHPVQDLAGYDDGDPLTMELSTRNPDGSSWSMRDYQIAAIDAFHSGSPGHEAGSGVVVLPCGAGKTIVGIGAMVRLGMRTLILCTGRTALKQWIREILERTTLTEDDVGEFSADIKELKAVTVTTYQILTWRPSKNTAPVHFRLFHEANWGLVMYDEVHLLPAPIFRESAYLQARRRLGLTATRVREDGHEGDLFALIVPKCFDMPWKHLESQGWFAEASCVEIRVPMGLEDRSKYLVASKRSQNMMAAKNARKGSVLETLLTRHKGESVLVLGTYLDHLEFLARRFGIPVVTGKTPAAERARLFEAFRTGEITELALSKVGNFSIDLPGASVAVQVSGTFGSRQEEAQRLGRVLRKKRDDNRATFYTLVSKDSVEETQAAHRQLFLTEQGYPYRIEIAP